MTNIGIREAETEDIVSLSAIIPRSFDDEAILNQLFPPNSLLIREWWERVYAAAINSSKCCVLVASDGKIVVGVLTLHFWSPGSQESKPDGLCTLVELTKDHDPMLRIALQQQAGQRAKLLGEIDNFMIDLLAVEKKWQGTGLGRKLVQKACEIADSRNAAIFLQTTNAKMFWLKLDHGFTPGGGEDDGSIIRSPRILVS